MDENVIQKLRPWIRQQLATLTTADFDTLTDYVIALLGNSKPLNELRETCLSQLRDFLGDSTPHFVDNLFQTLQSVSDGGAIPKVENSTPDQEMQMGGQEDLRANFRADRTGGDNHRPQYNQPQQSEQAGFWSNGVFIPFPNNMNNMPMPSNQGYFRTGNGPSRGGIAKKARGRSNPQRRKNDRSTLSSTMPEPDPFNRSLIVERIPSEHYNVEDVRGYFESFGELKNIMLHQDVGAVELEYATHDGAKAAYSSPAPVFNNRFVKVFWKIRPLNANGQVAMDLEAIRQLQEQRQQEFLKKQQERKETEAKLKERLSQKTAMLKLKQEQQDLRLKIARAEGKFDEAAEQQAHTEALKRQVELLKVEAETLGISTNAPVPFPAVSNRGRLHFRGRIRGGPRGRARGGFRPYAASRGLVPNPSMSLDFRPKSVVIVSVSPDKEEALRGHLVSVENIEDVSRNSSSDELIVHFKNRHSAEHFFYSDSNIADVGTIKKLWGETTTPRTEAS